jgi:hypothetical protein
MVTDHINTLTVCVLKTFNDTNASFSFNLWAE